MVVGEDNLAKGLQDLILKNHETYGLLYNKVTHNHIQHVSLIATILISGVLELNREGSTGSIRARRLNRNPSESIYRRGARPRALGR